MDRTIRKTKLPEDAEGIMDVFAAAKAIMRQSGNIRIDTHKDNHIMQHCIEKYGFSYCGIIHLVSKDERLAYQRMII